MVGLLILMIPFVSLDCWALLSPERGRDLCLIQPYMLQGHFIFPSDIRGYEIEQCRHAPTNLAISIMLFDVKMALSSILGVLFVFSFHCYRVFFAKFQVSRNYFSRNFTKEFIFVRILIFFLDFLVVIINLSSFRHAHFNPLLTIMDDFWVQLNFVAVFFLLLDISNFTFWLTSGNRNFGRPKNN